MKAAELKRLKKAAIKTVATVVAESLNELEKAIHLSLASLLQQPVAVKPRKARAARKPKAERRPRTFKQPAAKTTEPASLDD